MKCPNCGSESNHPVKETRKRDDNVVRRRHCMECDQSFQTAERVSAIGLKVRKTNGEVVPFSEQAVRRSVRRAAVHTGDINRLGSLTSAVVNAVRSEAESGVVDSLAIGDSILQQLKRLDRASHVRFALVHLGRLDRPGYPGWNSVEDVRSWLVEQYPDLQHFRPLVRVTEVVKKDGRREPFDREALEKSIGRASKGRGTAEEVRDLATQVAKKVIETLDTQPLVTTGQLSAEVLRQLRARDQIAFMRYSSTVKGFLNPEDYETEAIALRHRDT